MGNAAGETVLAFDFGTTNFKAAVVDADGASLASARVPTPVIASGDRSEISPRAFLRAVREACAALASSRGAGLADVAAVTFASQANTFVLLDARDRPLTPLIVWTDARAEPIDVARAFPVDDPDRAARSGLPRVGAAFSPAKLAWLARRDPDALANARRLCFLGDLLALWLTGEHVTDGSIAGFSGLFDVAAWAWRPDWVERTGLPVVALPRTCRSGTPVGRLRPDAARFLGLPDRCVFVSGLLDQFAGALGVGTGHPASDGSVAETTGTVLATVRSSASFEPLADGDVYRGPGPSDGTFFHMTFGEVSASLLDDYRLALPGATPGPAELDALVAAAGEGDPDPALRLDPAAPVDELRRAVRGWAGRADRAGATRAIYQVVCDALATQVRSLAGGGAVTLVRSAGGASRSRTWLQLKADALRVPVLAPSVDEPTVHGAAGLAARALGWPPVATVTPDPARLLRPRALDRRLHVGA